MAEYAVWEQLRQPVLLFSPGPHNIIVKSLPHPLPVNFHIATGSGGQCSSLTKLVLVICWPGFSKQVKDKGRTAIVIFQVHHYLLMNLLKHCINLDKLPHFSSPGPPPCKNRKLVWWLTSMPNMFWRNEGWGTGWGCSKCVDSAVIGTNLSLTIYFTMHWLMFVLGLERIVQQVVEETCSFRAVKPTIHS